MPTRYGFTGRERDDFSGLMYYRARFYDAKVGGFASEDPIGFAGGDVNLYGYVKNKSLMHRDPRGLDDADKEWYPALPGPPPPCFGDSDNPSPNMQRWCPLSELLGGPPASAYDKGWRAQSRHFNGPDPSGSADPYSGGYRHCVSSCILAKRYGPIGDLGRFLIHDVVNEILFPYPDSADDLKAERLGSRYGHDGGCETCEDKCKKNFPNGR